MSAEAPDPIEEALKELGIFAEDEDVPEWWRTVEF